MGISKTLLVAAGIFSSVILLPTVSPRSDTLTIEMAVSLGLENHPDLRIAQGGIDKARGRFWETVSPAPPVFSIEHEEIPSGSGLSDYGQRNTGISQSLEFPLVTYYRGRAANLEVRASKSNLDVARVLSENEIRLAFVEAWLAREKFDVIDSLTDSAARLYRIAERKESAGEITSLEKDRLLVQSENFKRDRQGAMLELDIAMTALAQLTGKGFDAPPVLLEPELPGGRIDSSRLSGNAYLEEMRYRERSMKSGLTAEKLSWLPSIEMRIFKQSVGDDKFWGGELGLSVPIWFPLGGRGRILGARGEARQTSAELEKTRRDWNLKWTEALGSYNLARQTLGGFEDVTLPASRRAFHAAMRTYEVGELGLTDLLSSFLQEKAVELDYLEALRDAWYWTLQLDALTAGSAE